MNTAADPIDSTALAQALRPNKGWVKLALRVCAHCGLCAESCFMYTKHGRDPRYMPAHKVIDSLGRLYRARGNVDRAALEEIREVVWERCTLCMRCYCPLGIDLPGLLALARSICRSQGVYETYDRNP